MRKNKFFIAGLVTVFVALVSLTLVSSTWAKYTSTVEGSDSARVAKWAWSFNGDEIDLEVAKSVDFDLFTTVEDIDTNDDDENVKDGSGEVIIAPGTEGKFVFEVTNDSEVTGEFDIVFSITNAGNVPLQFSLDGSTWVSDITTLDFAAQEVAYGDTSSSATLYWMWDFDGDDTHLGIKDTLDTVTVTATVTMTQVD